MNDSRFSPYGRPKSNQNFPRQPFATNPCEDVNHSFTTKPPYVFPQQLPGLVRQSVRNQIPTYIPTGRVLGVNDLRANPNLPQYFQYPERSTPETKIIFRPQQMNPAYKPVPVPGPVPRTFQVQFFPTF